MDSPPFQATIPPVVAKLVGDGSKLQGLHSRLLDADGNNAGTMVTTGFGSSPTFKSNASFSSVSVDHESGPNQTNLEDRPDIKSTALFPANDNSKSKLSTNDVTKDSSLSVSFSIVEPNSEEKLSGTKRSLPAVTDEERSVITIEEDSSSRDRKQRERKSPKLQKSSGLTAYVEDGDYLQGSNHGENNSRGIPSAPVSGQPRITTFFQQQQENNHNYNMNLAISNTHGSTPTATSTSTNTSGKSRGRDKSLNPSSGGNLNSSSSSQLSELTSTSLASNGTNSSAFTAASASNLLEMRKQLDSMRVAKEQAEIKVIGLESSLKSMSERVKTFEDRNQRLMKSLEDIHRKMAMQEFRRKRDQLALDCVRLGKIATVRTGPTTMGDVWEEGYAMKELTKRSAELLTRKEELESRKRKIATTKRAVNRKAAATASAAAASVYDGDAAVSFDSEVDVDMDLSTESEVIKAHFEQLKRDEIALAEERRLLDSEKAVHQKEIKRCQCEERSRFYRDLPALHDRYLLQVMLGRGGFSEVWKALDLQELKEVAVKIHQLNPQWSEERKASYIKHVTREYTIHRDMKHPRVVQLFDVFEIDMNSFATVLEYCRGIDLDEKLKRHKTVQEKDAKAIFMQILSGLRYLHHPYSYNAGGLYVGEDNTTDNTTSNATSNAGGGGGGIGTASLVNGSNNNNINNNNSINNNNNNTVLSSTSTTLISSGGNGTHHIHNYNNNNNNNINNNNHISGNGVVTNHTKKISIIHFDLKPANILFDEFGDVKITDFGLSKVIDESHEGTSMELTSQGAGTYWYLPPECFEKGPNPPRISSKVDVWSAGIIFYQMLYGSRPFGEGKTQENVWTENLIYNASSVEFPSDPKHARISDEAKDLIRACLTRDQRLRPDVIGVCQHPYFKTK